MTVAIVVYKGLIPVVGRILTDHQSDVFQLGKVFWYILQGNAPIGNIRRSDFFDGHDDIYSVLKYMLNHSKKKRPISIDYVINELSRIMQKYKFVC